MNDQLLIGIFTNGLGSSKFSKSNMTNKMDEERMTLAEDC